MSLLFLLIFRLLWPAIRVCLFFRASWLSSPDRMPYSVSEDQYDDLAGQSVAGATLCYTSNNESVALRSAVQHFLFSPSLLSGHWSLLQRFSAYAWDFTITNWYKMILSLSSRFLSSSGVPCWYFIYFFYNQKVIPILQKIIIASRHVLAHPMQCHLIKREQHRDKNEKTKS